jgi:L-lactate dehydrogenase complex protein LldG
VSGPTLVERLRAAFEANAATVHGPGPMDEAGDFTAALAIERAGGREVALAVADPVVEALDLSARLRRAGAALLLPSDVDWRDRLGDAGAGVTGAAFALAATGTVGLACGPGSPRSVSLVPPAHVCVVRTADIVEDLATALARIPEMPSGLVWISGPSRSADLELTLTLGVHGPGQVDIVLVDGDATLRSDDSDGNIG